MENGKVFTFKLNSGEELIAKIVEITRDNVIIQEPVSIAPSQQGMGLVPSMFTADPKGKFTLNTNSISLYAETEDNVKMKYLEATTGIKVPEKKIVLG
jgi:hypothetical protein